MNDVIDSSLGSFSSTSAVDALPGQVGQTKRPFSGLGSTVTGTGTTTGSWAEATHSVIWLTRGGNRLPLARVGRRSWGTNLISVAVIALTSLIAASNLLDVYGSAAMWAPLYRPPCSAPSSPMQGPHPRCACGGRSCS